MKRIIGWMVGIGIGLLLTFALDVQFPWTVVLGVACGGFGLALGDVWETRTPEG